MIMRNTVLALVGGLALGFGTMLTTGAAQAVPAGLSKEANADGFGLVEKAQFVYRGRRYCFYFDGWRGPGWYWCGYAYRRGYGWGGPTGWRGWHHSPRVYRAPVHRAPARVYRHEERRHYQNPPNFREQYSPRHQPKREY